VLCYWFLVGWVVVGFWKWTTLGWAVLVAMR
jgi:hypothetical protein